MILRQRRRELGVSQADLAEAAGVHLRQIRRYERGEQQPVLPVAVRLAGALGVSVDELAGLGAGRVRLDGDWWAAWQLPTGGGDAIATRGVTLAQRGAIVRMEALESERRAAPWHGELRLWDGSMLTGWYDDARTRGTILFVLRAGDAYAEGRWTGLAHDGAVATGHAALGRTRDDAQAVIGRLVQPG